MATVTKRRWTYKGVTKEAWTVRYLEPVTGKRPAKTFAMKKDADAFKRKVERDIEDGALISVDRQLTVADAAAKYLSYLAARLEDGAIGRSHHDRDSNAITRYALPEIGNLRFKNLTVEDAFRVYRKMTAAALKPASVKGYLFAIKVMEQWARAPSRRYTTTTAFADLMQEIRPPRSERVKTFTPEQVATLLEASRQRPHNYEARGTSMLACFVGLAALGGMRVGEIMALSLDDVLLEERQIRVAHNLTAWGERKEPKTAAGVRVIMIAERLVEPLTEWMNEHAVENPDRLLFTNRNGLLVHHSGIRARWVGLLQRCGFIGADGDRYHFHALRHFHASWLLKNGIPPTDVARVMGHADASVTLSIYSHALLGHDEMRAQINSTAALLPDARLPQMGVNH